ncbi:MAG: hypothetical protein J6S10_01690 [Clostridia bacterium]|nr:hypothetical protein [Clostridia bacterium]
MSKKLEWKITIEEEEHSVSLVYSMLFGKALITIDGDEFDISTGFGKLRGTNQLFKLGDSAAVIDFPKSGVPEVYVDGVGARTGKRYGE